MAIVHHTRCAALEAPDRSPAPCDCGAGEIARLTAEQDELIAALLSIEPYLDSLICYASTIEEYEPNRIVKAVRDLRQRYRGWQR